MLACWWGHARILKDICNFSSYSTSPYLRCGDLASWVPAYPLVLPNLGGLASGWSMLLAVVRMPILASARVGIPATVRSMLPAEGIQAFLA